jgi:hypothetical protein
VRSLLVRSLLVRSLLVRSLLVRSLLVRSLPARSLLVRSLPVRSLPARSVLVRGACMCSRTGSGSMRLCSLLQPGRLTSVARHKRAPTARPWAGREERAARGHVRAVHHALATTLGEGMRVAFSL